MLKFRFCLSGVLLIALLLTFFVALTPVRADCGGDLVCQFGEMIQRDVISPVKAWAALQAARLTLGFQYTVAHTLATFMWQLSKMLLTVALAVATVNDWLAAAFFQPMISLTSQAVAPLTSTFFFIALVVLGCTYSLAGLVRLNVVSARNMLLWWLAAALFYTLGPQFYGGLRDLSSSLSSVFYASALQTVENSASPFAALAGSDPAPDNPVYVMPPPCNNFTAYLPGSGGKINGIDVALAFQKADGADMFTGGNPCLGDPDAALIVDLPRLWYLKNGFFDKEIGPGAWPAAVPVCPNDGTLCTPDSQVDKAVASMQTSVNQAWVGVARLAQAIPVVWLAIVEQLVALCLAIAMGLTFLSFSCAVLFAFFKRTEPIAWAVIDHLVSLLIQMLMIAVLQGVILALYLSAGKLMSVVVAMAASIIALVLMVILLFSGLKSIWLSVNRLFVAVGQATGGLGSTPGAVVSAGVGMASLAAGSLLSAGGSSGAASLLGSGAGSGGGNALDLPRLGALDGAAGFSPSRMALDWTPSRLSFGAAPGFSAGNTLPASTYALDAPSLLLPAPRWSGTLDATQTNLDEVLDQSQTRNLRTFADEDMAERHDAAGDVHGALSGLTATLVAHPLPGTASQGASESAARALDSAAARLANAFGGALTATLQNQPGQSRVDGAGLENAFRANGYALPPDQVARATLFANQALGMGLDGPGAAQVIQEVRSGGSLTDPTRASLVQFQQAERGLSPQQSFTQVTLLENFARVLPNPPLALPDPVSPPPTDTSAEASGALEGGESQNLRGDNP